MNRPSCGRPDCKWKMSFQDKFGGICGNPMLGDDDFWCMHLITWYFRDEVTVWCERDI
jgi:hypothetical protein